VALRPLGRVPSTRGPQAEGHLIAGNACKTDDIDQVNCSGVGPTIASQTGEKASLAPAKTQPHVTTPLFAQHCQPAHRSCSLSR
jgi:hypothetical protein